VVKRAVLFVAFAFGAVFLAAASPAAAQDRDTIPIVSGDTAALRKLAEQKLGRGVSAAEVIARLRESGMTRSEVRARLRMAGQDPDLADRYFDIIENGGRAPSGDVPAESLLALSRIGIELQDSIGSVRRDTTLFADSTRAQRTANDTSTAGLEVFGLRVFRNATTQFSPEYFGPVDAGYRLGPGDQITLILTGDVEETYPLTITREGLLFIPRVGQVPVNNLTLGELRDVLYTRLGRVYSGVSRSPDATTRFEVAIGRLRTNQIFITGDIAAPGSYQVSSVAGLFNALYQAGGPTANGSFRNVEVWRGGRMIHTADLYDFLVRGNGRSDIRLVQGDRVFVPPVGTQVTITGAVRRPAIYEIRPDETVDDALQFAGGLSAAALAHRIQIDRILPPEQQTPGHYRALVDVNITDLSMHLVDGDILRVFPVTDERRNRVILTGAVETPGLYEWSPGITLWGLLGRADGLDEAAYTPRAHIYRIVESDGSRRLIQATLERDEAGRALQDLQLADGDSIVVFSRAELRNDEFVSIDGMVKQPDTYPLATGMTVRDLVLAAQGFVTGASMLEAEVARMPDPASRTARTAIVYRVPLNPADSAAPGEEAAPFYLQDGDHVFIRRAPGYEETRLVTIVGEVHAPGTYVLQSRGERLSNLIERAQSLTSEAYAPGIHVIRDSTVVAADLRKGLLDPTSQNNILLENGDSIIVPALDQTVTINGAVAFETKAIYVPGRELSWYLEQAGGTSATADRGRISVTYPNGQTRVVKRGLFRSGELPVEPGSVILVPERPEGVTGTDWGAIISRASAVLGTIATLLIAINAVK
jgi:protein involved in polysaccharide export with SLBB domain